MVDQLIQEAAYTSCKGTIHGSHLDVVHKSKQRLCAVSVHRPARGAVRCGLPAPPVVLVHRAHSSCCFQPLFSGFPAPACSQGTTTQVNDEQIDTLRTIHRDTHHTRQVPENAMTVRSVRAWTWKKSTLAAISWPEGASDALTTRKQPRLL